LAARDLLGKVPAKPDTGSALMLAIDLRKAALTGGAVGAATASRRQQDAPPRRPSAVRAPEVMDPLTPAALSSPRGFLNTTSNQVGAGFRQ
jgi:hypothetical protein